MVLLGIFWTSFVIALSGALMPGPVLTITISESAKRGIWAGPLIILGHAMLELCLVLFLLLGLGPYLKKDLVFVIIAFSGALILMWMARNMFRSIPSLTLALKANASSATHPVLAGLLMSLANPYWFIWWATIGVGYIVYATAFGTWGVVAFFSGHISADFAWYLGVSFAVSKGQWFIGDRAYKGIVGLCACTLMLFGFWFGYAGVHRLASILAS
jgi:threonine/homoserine/homoserine lactone efflux protein